jgi:hypothetical protein
LSKSQYILYLIIGLLTFGVTFVGLALFFPNDILDTEDSEETKTTQNSTSTSTEKTKEEEAKTKIPKNWKTYKNAKYKFLVKYPPKWILENSANKPLKEWYGIRIKTEKGPLPPHVKILPNNPEPDYYDHFGTEFNYLYKDEIIKTTFAGRKAKEKPGGYDKIVGVTWFRAIRIEDLKGLIANNEYIAFGTSFFK